MREFFIKIFSVSRLVGPAFIENYNALLDIDHLDRNKTNNHINNLRNVSRSENCRNRNKWAGCTSVHKGVSFYKLTEKWCAQAKFNGKQIHLGYYATEIEASQKYQAWNLEHGFLV